MPSGARRPTDSPSPARLGTALGRALRRRCPACGHGPIFLGWARMLPNCVSCGLALQRGETGYWIGAALVDLLVTLLLFHVNLALGLFWTPASAAGLFFQRWAVFAVFVLPLMLWPYAKVAFLAVDLRLRPRRTEDYAAPHEPGRKSLR